MPLPAIMESVTKTKSTSSSFENGKKLTLASYLKCELKRGYQLENDEERYAERREKVYTFFMIPRETEKFFAYGFFQCADSFSFVLTFLPLRFLLACWSLLVRGTARLLRLRCPTDRLLKPAESVDLVKGVLLLSCCYIMTWIDTSVLYHLIKTQSTIKLYLFFNILEIADRLMSAFGQDTLDALFWTATEPGGRRRRRVGGVVFHLAVALVSVFLHASIVLLQALALNVAINADNKGLLTILISNNFVELKGSVFKKFDRINLLQIACSDVRERFHLCVLMVVVALQTLKEYNWTEERLLILLPDCLLICGTEVLVDWIKHAFVTRFNDIPIEAYRDYTTILAHDLAMCKQKYADSDHSDLVARRMGFIPLPLGVVTVRILSQALPLHNFTAFVLLGLAFAAIISFRVLNGIVMLGKACDLIEDAEKRKARVDADQATAAEKPSTKTTNDPKAFTSHSTKAGEDVARSNHQSGVATTAKSVPVSSAEDREYAPARLASFIACDVRTGHRVGELGWSRDTDHSGCCRCIRPGNLDTSCKNEASRQPASELRADEEDGLEYLTPRKAPPSPTSSRFLACTPSRTETLNTPSCSCSGSGDPSLPVNAEDTPTPALYTTPFTTPTHLVKRVKGKRVRLDSGPMVQEIEPYPYYELDESDNDQTEDVQCLKTEGQDGKLQLRLTLPSSSTTSVTVSSASSTPSSPGAYDSTSLSFCHDTQGGLMANSMVNLASVGLNQGPHSPEEETRPSLSSLRSSCTSLTAVEDELHDSLSESREGSRPVSCPSAQCLLAPSSPMDMDEGKLSSSRDNLNSSKAGATSLPLVNDIEDLPSNRSLRESHFEEHLIERNGECDQEVGNSINTDQLTQSRLDANKNGTKDVHVNEGENDIAVRDRNGEDNDNDFRIIGGQSSLGRSVSAPDVRISEDSDDEDLDNEREEGR